MALKGVRFLTDRARMSILIPRPAAYCTSDLVILDLPAIGRMVLHAAPDKDAHTHAACSTRKPVYKLLQTYEAMRSTIELT